MSIEFERICHQIEDELSSYENLLNKLAVLEYPSTACKEALDDLRERIGRYRKLTQEILEDMDEGSSAEATKKLVAKIHNPLLQDVRFLQWIRDAQTGAVPWSFIPCIERLAGLLIPNPSVLVFCDYSHNYAIRWSLNRRLAPYAYAVLSLPKLHRVNILWHCLVGHELFHPCCSGFIDQVNKQVLVRIAERVSKQMKKSSPSDDACVLFSQVEEKKRLDMLADMVHTAWRRATEELLCDMACVALFGPAAVLAMRAFCACSPANDEPSPENNFYPPWRYRFEVTFGLVLEDQGLQKLMSSVTDEEVLACFKTEIEAVQALVHKREGATCVKKHPLAKIAYDEFERLAEQATQYVKNAISSSIPCWHDDHVLNQIPHLVARLKNGIPPNEVILRVDTDQVAYETEPAEIAAIMLAGWMFETYWQRRFSEGGPLMNYRTLSRLILKSLEDAERARGERTA